MLSSQPSIPTIDGAEGRLTHRQKESMQILMKAMADFLHEDRYETESIAEMSDYELEEMSEKRPSPRKKTTAQRFQECDTGRSSVSVLSAPPNRQISQSLVSACNVLVRESIAFEYSLRTLGAGGPGMYGAWVLRRNLRAFSEVVEDCNIDELHESSTDAELSERYRLGPIIDGLPVTLYGLWKAFDELESFLLDFVSFYHSVELSRVLRTLKASLKKQRELLLSLRTKPYVAPAEGQATRDNLLAFFAELEKSFQIFSSELTDFRKQGVPLIRTTQSNQSDRYLMFTTISTFFSAVTSATLQISFQENSDGGSDALDTAVNLFFFSSLIFSTASAVQALLAMAWIRSFIRVPHERLAYQWVSKGPLFSLVMSGVFFAIGLCLFVIASQKDSVTTFFVVIFALIHAIGLIAMTVWFVFEQWSFRRHSSPIGRKLTETSVMMSTLAWFVKIWQLKMFLPPMHISSFSGLLPKWLHPTKRGAELGDASKRSSPKEVMVSESSSFEVDIEPPSRPESVMSVTVPANVVSWVPGRSDRYYHEFQAKEKDRQRHQIEDEVVRSSVVTEGSDSVVFQTVSGDVHVSEEYPEPSDPRHVYSSAEPEPSAMSWDTENQTVLGTSIVEEPSGAESLHVLAGPSSGEAFAWADSDAQRALPISHTDDFLQVRKESWQEGLRQDSITYMEMYNRRNPKKKRTYPPLEPPAPP